MPDIGDNLRVNELQQLQIQSSLSKLITAGAAVTSPSATTTICSYTPSNGNTFVLFQATWGVYGQTTSGTSTTLQLRNNGTVKGTGAGSGSIESSGVLVAFSSGGTYPVKGDQLVGTGSLVYDIYNVSALTGPTVFGSICGYLL